MKRLSDILLSSIGLILLSPILIVIIAILGFTGEGEIFFLQQRIGYRCRPFHITKFATMLKSAAHMKQGDFTIQNDPRVLPIGRFLRKSKINELLQLWDVVRGEMSLVGPRPQMLRVHALYPEGYASVLQRVRPGITGVGSIVFRDEERILTRAPDREYCYARRIVPYKAELEQWYADNRSMALDLALIAITIWCVIIPDSDIIFKLLPERLRRDVHAFSM